MASLELELLSLLRLVLARHQQPELYRLHYQCPRVPLVTHQALVTAATAAEDSPLPLLWALCFF